MTTLLKNASYLKVSHSGQTTGSLLLADLADEENAKQEKKIPVYVPENGSITLPLDEDVLLSYQQGTIRGLEDQGYVTTTLLDNPSLMEERWVSSVNGDDTNPGTREAPFTTIQAGVDALKEVFTPTRRLVLKVEPDIYEESVFVNFPNLEIVSTSNGLDASERVRVNPPSGPSLVLTPATRESWDQFVTDGGVSFTRDDTSWTWSGGDVINREIDPTWAELQTLQNELGGFDSGDFPAQFKCEGITWMNDAYFIGMSDTATAAKMDGLRVLNCDFSDPYFKNVSSPAEFGTLNSLGSVHLDNCDFIDFSGNLSDLYVRVKEDAAEGAPSISASVGEFHLARVLGEVKVYHDTAAAFGGFFNGRGFGDIDDLLTVNGDAEIGINASRNVKDIYVAGPITLRDTSIVRAGRVVCTSLTKPSSGELIISDLRCSGNVDLTGGSVNELSGVIKGNLTIDGAVSADLTDLVVKGDVSIGSGAGTITWSGGSFHGTLTDPDSKLGAPASGSYLNV